MFTPSKRLVVAAGFTAGGLLGAVGGPADAVVTAFTGALLASLMYDPPQPNAALAPQH